MKNDRKRFERVIEHCTCCPNVGTDQNITRWMCQPKNKMVCWMGDKEDEHPIPEWCPLHPLTACPWCKSTDIVTTSYGVDTYAVLCNGCGAEGPSGKDAEDAENLWVDREGKCQK
jgi:hypothetical protein